jgi:hypothetical protein
MVSGQPTIRSQRYKKQQLLLRDMKFQGSDVLPPPLADLASDSSPSSRAFSTLYALVKAACLAASVSGPPMEHILQTALGWIVDCSQRFHETQAELSTLRQQLSDANKRNDQLHSELAETNAKLSQSLLKEDFYREQAQKMNLVPPHRRLRSVAPASDNPRTPEQLDQQALHHRDALAARDQDIQRLQSIQTDLDGLIEASTAQAADRLRALEQQVARCTALHEATRPKTPVPASDDEEEEEEEEEEEDELFPSAGRILERYKASLVLDRYHATVASLHDRLESLASPRPPRLTPREPITPRAGPCTPRAADAYAPRAGAYAPHSDPCTPRAGPCALRLDPYTPRSAGAAGASPPRSARARPPPLTPDQVAAVAAAGGAVPSPSWAAFAPAEPAVINPRLRRRLDPGNPLW